MKGFIKQLLLFTGILVLFAVTLLLLPPTPRSATSGIHEKLEMDRMLKDVNAPRLILVGGSNISLSISSGMIKDSLHVNPINTGLSVNIGLSYMLDNTLRYLQAGDIVVISAEYSHFFNNLAYGGEDLAKIALEVSRKELFQLRFQQLRNILPHVPYHVFTKLKSSEYFFTPESPDIYSINSFNEYGDNVSHWNLPGRQFRPINPLPTECDLFVFDLLSEFKSKAESKGAQVYITFPGLQASSFENQKDGIKMVETQLRKNNFKIIGTPERYKMADSLMFDTPYHLIKAGVDLRTGMLIEDLRKTLIVKR